MNATTSLCLFTTVLTASLQAQEAKTDPTLPPAQTRLDKALAQAAALSNGTFTARWDASDLAGGGAMVVFAAGRGGAAPAAAEMNVKASGCWHDDLLQVHFDNSAEHDLLQRGRRIAVRAGKGEWKLSRDRFADGGTRGFVPDPSQLAALLAQLRPKVMRREVGTLDDRPVETLTVILSGDEAAAVTLAGLLPPPANAGGFIVFGAGGAPVAQPSLIDLAFHLDPATGTLHRVDARIHSSTNMAGMAGGRMRVMVAGGAVVAAEEAAEEDDGSRKTFDEAVKQTPEKFQGGLPVRKLKDCTTTRFELRLSEQGTTKAPVVDEKVQTLLGR